MATNYVFVVICYTPTLWQLVFCGERNFHCTIQFILYWSQFSPGRNDLIQQIFSLVKVYGAWSMILDVWRSKNSLDIDYASVQMLTLVRGKHSSLRLPFWSYLFVITFVTTVGLKMNKFHEYFKWILEVLWIC